MRVHVEGVGLAGPGLANWDAARPVLAGAAPFEPAPLTLPPVTLLPPAERRRAGLAVKLAFTVGVEALEQSGRAAEDMATVFTASAGDGDTIHEILNVLATPAREVSPTRFHNSVHNAPSGYWAVATGSRAPSTSLGAFDGSFAAGLLDAATQAVVDRRPVTLIAYDVPYPEPLHSVRPIAILFGCALVLTPEATERSLAALDIEWSEAAPATLLPDPALEQLRTGNPAARALPLLAALARGEAAHVVLGGIEGAAVTVTVTPA
ncbi:MAG TPA: beta-ketoacyl synthase chain length factor [Acetobacteraceae bacterium]